MAAAGVCPSALTTRPPLITAGLCPPRTPSPRTVPASRLPPVGLRRSGDRAASARNGIGITEAAPHEREPAGVRTEPRFTVPHCRVIGSQSAASTDLVLDDPAATGTGAGAEAQLARAMQGAAIPIMETPPERT